MTGSISEPKDPKTLDADGQAALQVARNSNADLEKAQLESYRTQVVEGIEYYFKFKGVEKDVKVWCKPGNICQVVKE